MLSESDDESPAELNTSFQPPYNIGRRVSVSAESCAPSTEKFVKTVIPKTEVQRQLIRKSVENNFVFRWLDEEQYNDVVNAMKEKRVTNKEKVIVQGEQGDYFYVVDSGTLDCFVGDKKVTMYNEGGSFGELALMYNAPRAATIIATSDATLWALDGLTFRRIVRNNVSQRRDMYEGLLGKVELLESLEKTERQKIADALDSVNFTDGQSVVKQGESGDHFYMIESGNAIVYKTNEDGVTQEVGRLASGSYFGELALLHDKPRAATVTAVGNLRCAKLDKNAFTRLLGPVLDILKRNSHNYDAVIKQQELQ